MFIVMYEFKIKKGKDEPFIKAWVDHTEFVYAQRGSLGSRLHETETEDTYVAYAQWPSKEQWRVSSTVYEESPPETLLQMKELLVSSKVVRQLSVCADNLKTELET